MPDMRCRDVMTRLPACLAGEDTLQVAARKMRQLGLGFLPVCGAHGEVVGSLPDREVVSACADGIDPAYIRVRRLMGAVAPSCGPDDELGHVHSILRENGSGRVLVVDTDDALLGVVSVADLACVDPVQAGETLRELSVALPTARAHRPLYPVSSGEPAEEELPSPLRELSEEPWE